MNKHTFAAQLSTPPLNEAHEVVTDKLCFAVELSLPLRELLVRHYFIIYKLIFYIIAPALTDHPLLSIVLVFIFINLFPVKRWLAILILYLRKYFDWFKTELITLYIALHLLKVHLLKISICLRANYISFIS